MQLKYINVLDPSNNLNHHNQSATQHPFYVNTNGQANPASNNILLNNGSNSSNSTNATNNVVLYPLNASSELRHPPEHNLNNNNNNNSSTPLAQQQTRRLTQDWHGSYPAPSPFSNPSLLNQSQSAEPCKYLI
jgi:hypothetical protein